MKYFKHSFRYLLLLFPAILSAAPVQLSWTDNSDNEESFVIERKSEGEYVEVATVAANITQYTDDVEAGSYQYRVKAVNQFGSSGYTNDLVVGPPKAPSTLTNKITVIVTLTVE